MPISLAIRTWNTEFLANSVLPISESPLFTEIDLQAKATYDDGNLEVHVASHIALNKPKSIGWNVFYFRAFLHDILNILGCIIREFIPRFAHRPPLL